MFGCDSAAIAFASRSKRASASGCSANAAGSTFKAISRSRRRSRARYTSPMPPAPIEERISYAPMRCPAANRMTAARDYNARVNRRAFVTSSGMAALGFGLSGCATNPKPSAASPKKPMLRLAPVKVSWDRIIRTTVGLRPHRDAGFVLKPDKLDDKLLVHNYGHGGAGMSLAWGTGLMAAEFATEHQARKAAVIGCGSVGLTCARQLQRRGFDVTIYAAAVPPDTTSNMSLAGFTPTTALVNKDKRTPEWDAQFQRAAEISYRQLQLMVGRTYG